MSLRDRLENKERKRLVVPIQTSDPGRDHEAWMGAAGALRIAQTNDEATPEYKAELSKLMDEAEKRYLAHFAEVELQALIRSDWEAAMAEWQGEETIDWDAALAPLLALSCTDPELQDEAWWAEQLAKPSWTDGEFDGLKTAILSLNVQAWEPRYPKD